MKSKHFASICTGTSSAFIRRAGTRSVGTPHGNACASPLVLEANGFFSEIPPEVVDEAGNPVTVTETAAALPRMNGSGMVRNLQAAMSLSGTQADELEAALTAFAAATTRDAQRAQLDTLITEWAQTSGYWSSLETYLGGTVTLNPPAGMTAAEYRNMIAVLEALNGSHIHPSAEFIEFDLTANLSHFDLVAWHSSFVVFSET